MKKIILFILLVSFSQYAFAATRLRDEGTSQGFINEIDCTGAGISCSRSGIKGTLNVGGGGGASITVEEADSTVDAAATDLDFRAGFDVSSSPAGEANITLDSTEAGFLGTGAITCGASTAGKIAVHTTPLQYCDNAATPALQYTAYADSSGNATGLACTTCVDTGDVAGDAVTYAKIQNVSATDKVLGRSTAGSGDVEEITFNDAIQDLAQETVADDQIEVYDSSTAGTPRTIPNCTDTGGNHLNYTQASNTFSCGTSSSGGGSGATDLDLSIYSAKLTGAFTVFTPPTADACSQGAQIDAGDGNWRLLFDPTTDECATWQFVVPSNYSSTPLLQVYYSMTSATSGTVEFEAAIMCVTSGDAADIGTASFSNVAVASETVPGTAGFMSKLTITLTDDSCAAGDTAFVVLSTDANDITNDTATGDREVVGVDFDYS